MFELHVWSYLRKCLQNDLQKPYSARHWGHINPYRVFVLADPEVFSGSLGQVLHGDIEASASGGFLSPLDLMRTVVQHTIQAALGPEQCSGLKLAQALKVSYCTLLFVCTQLLPSVGSSHVVLLSLPVFSLFALWVLFCSVDVFSLCWTHKALWA